LVFALGRCIRSSTEAARCCNGTPRNAFNGAFNGAGTCNDRKNEAIRKVELVPHDPGWRVSFLKESKQIALAMGEKAVTVHHIGSTAIPSFYAKPIIDFLIEVKDLAKVES
jgi:GrpB-like predicted nucleotidyltransferase (UPF0157 family)